MQTSPKILMLLFCFFFPSAFLAQNPQWINFNVSNSGLPINKVRTVQFDSSGSAWIGTLGGGLVKYDGATWSVFNKENSGLPHNDVYAIDVVSKDSIWIGTYGGGAACYHNGSWSIFNKYNSGLTDNTIYDIKTAQNGIVWIGANTGIFEYKNKEWSRFTSDVLPEVKVPSITIDGDNNVWIGSLKGIFRFDGKECFPVANNLMPKSSVYSLQAKKGRIAAGFKVDGAAVLDNGKWSIYSRENGDFDVDNIYSVAFDDSLNLWAASFGSGVFKFDGKQWKTFTVKNSPLTDGLIFFVNIDKYNNKWLCSYFKGIFIYNENGIASIKPPPLK
jgi:ligand-binding sensor domain-containing protein